jgi:hypothetical protein
MYETERVRQVFCRLPRAKTDSQTQGVQALPWSCVYLHRLSFCAVSGAVRKTPTDSGGIASLRRSVLSIARGQWKDRYSIGVTCSPRAIALVGR